MGSIRGYGAYARVLSFFVVLAVCCGFSALKSALPRRALKIAQSTLSAPPAWTAHSRVSILTEINDQPGSLHEILRYFWKYDINLTHIESRPAPKNNDGFHIYIDFDGHIGEANTDKLIAELKHRCRDMLVLDEKEVPWFPRHISELDLIAPRIKDAGSDLEADHPGFHDKVYRARRTAQAQVALLHKHGEELPLIDYTNEEVSTWGTIYNKLTEVHAKYACPEYLSIFKTMEKEVGYSPTRIPQARDISSFLHSRTGFTLRPVAGLLSSRDFLNGLAFKVFFSTQYIRHSSKPLYTPEPDIVHELIGHAPMFADQDFADFSQEIGLASLGASDEVVMQLASCYWHSVEFGLVRGTGADAKKTSGLSSAGEVKAYGAGLLSSFGELEYACKGGGRWRLPDANGDVSDIKGAGGLGHNPNAGDLERERTPILTPWAPKVAGHTAYPITDYQPLYFVADSLASAKIKMRDYCESIRKPFHARYNTLTNSIWVDRAVKVDSI